MNDKSIKLFTEILSDFIYDRQSELTNISEIDIDKIFDLAVKNNVCGILYYQLKDSALDNSFMNNLHRHFLFSCSDSIKKEKASAEISNILNENKIDHIFFKGTCIKNLYPVPEMRTMGDIDILIRPEDNIKVKKLLIENDYIFLPSESYAKVNNYKKNNVVFEIHTGFRLYFLF